MVASFVSGQSTRRLGHVTRAEQSWICKRVEKYLGFSYGKRWLDIVRDPTGARWEYRNREEYLGIEKCRRRTLWWRGKFLERIECRIKKKKFCGRENKTDHFLTLYVLRVIPTGWSRKSYKWKVLFSSRGYYRLNRTCPRRIVGINVAELILWWPITSDQETNDIKIIFGGKQLYESFFLLTARLKKIIIIFDRM